MFSGLKKESGFTLIEVMVSLVMMSIIVAAILGTLWTAMGSWERGTILSEVMQTDRALLERLHMELKSTLHIHRPNRAGIISQEGKASNTGKTGLIFVTSAGSWPGLSVVRYRIGEVQKGGKGLLRSEILLPHKLDFDDIQKDLDDVEMLLIPGISGMDTSFFDGENWEDKWDPKGIQSDIPVAVRVDLLEEKGKLERWLSPVIVSVYIPEKRGKL